MFGLDFANLPRITINGKSFRGKNIRAENGNVYVDEKLVSDEKGTPKIEIVVEGNLENLRSDGSISVEAQHVGPVDAGGSVQCGDVIGNVDCGGSIQCGNISGNISKKSI